MTDEIWWREGQWDVTAYGLEVRRSDGDHEIPAYAIPADRLLEGLDEDYPWPFHMASKNWVDISDFATAWMIALILHEAELPDAYYIRCVIKEALCKSRDLSPNASKDT
jgi:hypothetical protein